MPTKRCSNHEKVEVECGGWKRELKRSQPCVRCIVPDIGKHSGERTHGLSSYPFLGGLPCDHNFKADPLPQTTDIDAYNMLYWVLSFIGSCPLTFLLLPLAAILSQIGTPRTIS